MPETPRPPQRAAPAKLHIYSTDALLTGGRSVLYIGPEGSGKTHNIFTWPGLTCVYWESNLGTMMKFPHVPVIFPGGPEATPRQKVDDWKRNILPAIQNRHATELVREIPGFEDYKVRTVAVDSFTGVGRTLHQKLCGNKPDVKLDYDAWNEYLNSFIGDLSILTDCTRPNPARPERECYNFVASVHEHIVTKKDGGIEKIVPLIQGQFRDQLCTLFDTVLRTSSKRVIVTEEGPDKGKARVRYLCHTIPPDAFRTARDGIGGGRYNQLPPELVGTYDVLAKEWGLEDHV